MKNLIWFAGALIVLVLSSSSAQQISNPGLLSVIAGTGITVTNGTGPFVTIATSGSSGVTTTGSPASGNLTKFSGAGTITNGDISSDCTTSGTLAITCTKTSGTAFKNGATTIDTSRGSSSNPSAVTIVDAWDSQFDIIALAQTVSITLPACTSMNHFVIRVKDTGSSHTLTWTGTGTILDLQDTHPTATVAGKQMYLGFYCNTSNVYDFVAYNVQP